MMFEFSVAFKYLIPRWRQLSVSIISLISIFVIALVVWLIVVFFSVTHGLEKGWIQKLIALSAPIRISPTQEYYNSYYYLIDSLSVSSDYTLKTLEEKLLAEKTDPYDPHFDQEIPPHFPKPDLDANQQLRDPVKQAFASIEAIKDVPGISREPYEMTVANLKLTLNREHPVSFADDPESDYNQPSVSQATYISSFDSDNANMAKIVHFATKEDIQNLVEVASITENGKKLLDHILIRSLKSPETGQKISLDWLPKDCELKVCAINVGGRVQSVFLPINTKRLTTFQKTLSINTVKADIVHLVKRGGKVYLQSSDEEMQIDDRIPIFLHGSLTFTVLDTTVSKAGHMQFHTKSTVQGVPITAIVDSKQMSIDAFETKEAKSEDFWFFTGKLPKALPNDSELGSALLLPKNYRQSGVLIGDRGNLCYQTATPTSIQEQRVPIYVAGFYDPGILPFGGKVVVAPKSTTSMIRSSYPTDQSALSNGINVRFDDLEDADSVKEKLKTSFLQSGIDKYFRIETFREFEFTKDILQQLRSEKNLFTIIAILVIMVACANIVSMLIILVNNKKMEIGILRAQGATHLSIATIFGACGVVMGLIGSAIGLIAALFTLHHLQVLVDFISHLQGFDAFNPLFYGDALPNEVSVEALVFVMGATAITSLIAGIIPAVKASFLRPSAILRSE